MQLKLSEDRKIDSFLTTPQEPCFNMLYPKINLNYKGVAIMLLQLSYQAKPLYPLCKQIVLYSIKAAH